MSLTAQVVLWPEHPIDHALDTDGPRPFASLRMVRGLVSVIAYSPESLRSLAAAATAAAAELGAALGEPPPVSAAAQALVSITQSRGVVIQP
jgi:hypothetical protein